MSYVKYLKKKKLYEIAKLEFGSQVPALKSCEYDFYHGREWLRFFIADRSLIVDLVSFKGHVFKKLYSSDPETFSDRVLISRENLGFYGEVD